MKPWEYREEVHGNRPPPQPASDKTSYHPDEKCARAHNQEDLSSHDYAPNTATVAVLETAPEPEMPPDIRAAYECGESVTFSKARGRWELYKVLEPPVDLSDEARGLLLLYEMGELPQRVHERLTELFTENPTDIDERLEKAARFVKEQTA